MMSFIEIRSLVKIYRVTRTEGRTDGRPNNISLRHGFFDGGSMNNKCMQGKGKGKRGFV